MAGFRRQVRRSWGEGCMAFLTKIRDGDAQMGWKARSFIRWWVFDLSRRLLRPERRRWHLTFHEWLGAMIGLTGTYRRSVRRSARIRHAAEGR
jgi:hypothetical protein